MKLIITAAFCFSSLMCRCQLGDESTNHQLPDTTDFQKRLIQLTVSENRLLTNKQGNIAFLPQDRMPCLVGDSAAIRPIPNAWLGVQVPYKPRHHAIPNPSRRIISVQYNVLDDGALPSKK